MERVTPALHPPALPWRADHRLRGRATRCSTSPTSTTASTASCGASSGSRRARRQRDDQPRLRPRQHARARRRADRRRARRGPRRSPGHRSLVGRGHPLCRRHPQGARPARLGAEDAARRRHPARVAWFRNGGSPTPSRTRARDRRGARRRTSPASSRDVDGCLNRAGAGRRDLRPDGVGQERRRRGARRAPRRRGRLRRLGGALRGARRCSPPRRAPADASGRRRAARRACLGRRLPAARARGDRRAPRRRPAPDPRRWHRPLPAGRARRRCRCRRRPQPGARDRSARLYDELGAEGAHALLAERDRCRCRAPPPERPPPGRPGARAERAGRLARTGARPALEPTRRAIRRCSSGSSSPPSSSSCGYAPGSRRWSTRASSAEARAAWAQPLSETARRVLGLEPFATLPLAEAIEATGVGDAAARALPAKWLRRLTAAARLAADRPPRGDRR